ncbi:MAG: hypothetical protein JRF38_16560 [Deltaproteobacteria bacterium]|nr:hypothetical protein [Deltaproteobacteria bacterium]
MAAAAVDARVAASNLCPVPEEVKLRVGTTASVLVMTGTGSVKGDKRKVDP